MKERKKMRTRFRAILLCLLLCLPGIRLARGEISVNLETHRKKNSRNTYVVRVTYTDGEEDPQMAGDKGYAILKYTRNRQGLLWKEELLDEDENLVRGTENYAWIEYKYNKDRRLISKSWYDTDGSLVMGPEGAARITYTYINNRLKRTAWLDEEETVIEPSLVYHYWNGKRVRETWEDEQGNLMVGPEGYAVAETTYAGDLQTRISYRNTDGTPYLYRRVGYATKVNIYSHGRLSETAYYGDQDELIAGPKGYAYVLYTWKNAKTRIEMYHNPDGSLWYNGKGYCGQSRHYGYKNRVDEEIFFVEEGVRGLTSDGFSRIVRAYNSRGKVTLEKCYDNDEQLVFLENKGYSWFRNEYLNGKYLTKTEYFDQEGNPIRIPRGYAVEKHEYELRKVYGRQTRVRVRTVYLDTDGKTRINCTDGYAEAVYTYDDYAKLTSEAWFDAENKPAAVRGEASMVLLQMDSENQNRVLESFWADGEPVNGPEGAHLVRTRYNGQNKVLEKIYRDADGEETLCADGYARLVNEYNLSGALSTTRYLDPDGRLLSAQGKEYAYARSVPLTELDLRGCSAPYLPVESGEEGTLTEYYGTDGGLMLLSDGYAYRVQKNGDTGAVAEEMYFAPDGTPALYKDMYHRVERTWLDAKKKTSEAWFDAEGTPVTAGDLYARVDWEYDGEARRISEKYFDGDGNSVACRAGYREIHWYYTVDAPEAADEEDGDEPEESLTGTDGEPDWTAEPEYEHETEEGPDPTQAEEESFGTEMEKDPDADLVTAEEDQK